jgi:CheY-like chemotaxis protein
MIEKADRPMQDNIVNQRVLQKQLQSKGFIVHVANHGGEALDTLRRSHFWSDNNLPSDSHEPTLRDLGTVDTNTNDTDQNSSHGQGHVAGQGNQSTSHNVAEALRLGDSNISFDSIHASNPGKLDLHVVLMDQEMPIMDGLECTKAIREWEREAKLSSHVPIIGVTANARQQQINALINAGMVSNPFLLLFTIPRSLYASTFGYLERRYFQRMHPPRSTYPLRISFQAPRCQFHVNSAWEIPTFDFLSDNLHEIVDCVANGARRMMLSLSHSVYWT